MDNNNFGDECCIAWDSSPDYAALLLAHSEDFSSMLKKVDFLQLEKDDA